MDLSTMLYLAAVVACPIAMGGMMWIMMKQMGGGQSGHGGDNQPIAGSTAERLAALRAQREALEAEITEASRLVELEAQRDALLTGKPAGLGVATQSPD